MKVLFERYDLGSLSGFPQICASEEAETRRYHMVRGKSGRLWFVADQPDMAGNVYVEGGKGSNGFAGRWLTFPLVDGRTVKTKGPWHTNSDALFKDTGIDIRDTYLTRVIVAKDQGSTGAPKWISYFVDVVYFEEEPQMGHFGRGDEIATKIANELGQPVQCFRSSMGGSSRGPVYPDSFTKEDQAEYWKNRKAIRC